MNCAERYRIAPDGTVVTVYTDTIDLRALGLVRALRASVVEWDESAQAWIARILASGEVLGPFVTRAQAVSAERAVLATRLAVAAKRNPSGPPRPGPGDAHRAWTRGRGAPLARRINTGSRRADSGRLR
jgi:hypothetical protein